jgi:hypothetical protein
VGPEIIPRKFDLERLLKYEQKKIAGIGIKNHFFPTVAMQKMGVTAKKPLIIHSVTLNNYVGGFNPKIIQAAAKLSANRIIVWFPTLSAKRFLSNQKYEIPPEWISVDPKRNIKNILDKTRDAQALSIFTAGEKNIRKEVLKVLQTIKKHDAILATGHISWQESRELIKIAVKKFKIKRVIITHPIYQKINMPIEIQKELANIGAFIEHSYSMSSIDGISIDKIVEQIRSVGADNCILTSDVGQIFSPSPSKALTKFAKLLLKKGITDKELKKMLIFNPKILIL